MAPFFVLTLGGVWGGLFSYPAGRLFRLSFSDYLSFKRLRRFDEEGRESWGRRPRADGQVGSYLF